MAIEEAGRVMAIPTLGTASAIAPRFPTLAIIEAGIKCAEVLLGVIGARCEVRSARLVREGV